MQKYNTFGQQNNYTHELYFIPYLGIFCAFCNDTARCFETKEIDWYLSESAKDS